MIRRQYMHRFEDKRIEMINLNSSKVNSRSLEVKEYFLDMGILTNTNEEFDDDFNDKILTMEPIMSFFDTIGKTWTRLKTSFFNLKSGQNGSNIFEKYLFFYLELGII